jgi:acetyl esterase/lipase
MAAITYTTGTDPAADGSALFAYVRRHAASLGVDEKRIGLWACSGHGPTALSMLITETPGSVACAAFLYSYTLDLDGHTAIAEASSAIRFANPAGGRTVEDLPPQTALLLARAERDETPGLNEALDRFAAAAIRRTDVHVIGHPGPHAFDLVDDSEDSREVIRRVLAFFRSHLAGGSR